MGNGEVSALQTRGKEVKNWSELSFWKSGEHQVIQERYEDAEQSGRVFNPSRDKLYRSLDLTPFETVKVAIIGQDPYPDHEYATGIAFEEYLS